MEVMGLIAIIVNCYLIGQCGQLQRLFPWLSPEMAIISIVILEVLHSPAHIGAKTMIIYYFPLSFPLYLMPEHTN